MPKVGADLLAFQLEQKAKRRQAANEAAAQALKTRYLKQMLGTKVRLTVAGALTCYDPPLDTRNVKRTR